jgi:CheY-like chemotaxis protein
LIDDEEFQVDLGKQMLERLGYKVTAKTDSIGALKLFRAASGKFDLVITDMTMPKMTGEKLAMEFMNIRRDVPIILCTGYSDQINEEKAKRLGIKEYVMKPIVIKDLAKTIRKLLDE